MSELSLRIVSLVPSATEILFALGAGSQLVAVTHECDYPQAAAELQHITRDSLGEDLSSLEIDAAVRERTERGEAIYELDRELLGELEPDLIVTQALCPVCAVSYDDVRAVADEISSRPDVIALDPKTLGEVLGDIRTLAQATDRKDAGVELVGAIARRIDRVRLAVRDARKRSVLALEWLDPPYTAGHWTPQLIEYAGGYDVIGLPGEPSKRHSWDELTATEPETVVAMPCGYDADRSLAEALSYCDPLRSLGARKIVAVDAAAYFSRPGPRLIDGLELLAHILHPKLVPAAAGVAHEVVCN